MTYDDVIVKWPHLREDAQSILEWFSLSHTNRHLLEFTETHRPISEFRNQIVEMAQTLKEFPRDHRRVIKIYKILKHGGDVYPIFVDQHNFIMEGRHRVVAQYLSRHKEVIAISVTSQEDESLQEIKFTTVPNIELVPNGKDYTYKFDVTSNQYVVDFVNVTSTTSVPNSWSVSFRFNGAGDDGTMDGVLKLLTVNPYSNTGLGNEYKVYSHVISAILEFIGKVAPSLVYFDARDKKRARIYRKIAEQLLTNISDYTLRSGSVVNDIYSFVLTRNNIP
jgi:hypothetical protein